MFLVINEHSIIQNSVYLDERSELGLTTLSQEAYVNKALKLVWEIAIRLPIEIQKGLIAIKIF